MAHIKHAVVWIVFLMLYVVAGIPLINNYLLPMSVDWINNNSSMLIINFSLLEYKYNSTSGQFESQPSVVQIDLRGFVVWLLQFTVYIIVPLAIVLAALRR